MCHEYQYLFVEIVEKSVVFRKKGRIGLHYLHICKNNNGNMKDKKSVGHIIKICWIENS